jgi:hypothetical protein
VSDDYVITSKFRTLSGSPRALLRGLLYALTLLGALWALEIHHSLALAFFKEQYLSLFLALGLGSIFLGVKARGQEVGYKIPWYDWLLA